MAPEVWEGIGIGPVSDVYAMGVMMYEFLTGSYPFNIRRREDFKVAHRDDLRTPPSSFNPMFTSKMDQVLLSSLQKASAFRPEKPSDFTGRMIDAVKTAKLENLLLRSLQRESVPNFRRDQQKDREKSPVGISGRMQRVYDNQWSAEDRKKLRNMDIFHGMAARDVILLLEAGLLTEFEKGKTLFRKGEPADKMYVIIEGEVEIIQPASLDDEGLEPGVDRVINRVGPGTVFGEIALLLGDVRTASVRAATDVRALGIGQQELDLIVARPHRASLNLLINLARSVARTLKKAEERTRTGSSDSIEAVTDK
jgi:CRP-like cAMP-binding protein